MSTIDPTRTTTTRDVDLTSRYDDHWDSYGSRRDR